MVLESKELSQEPEIISSGPNVSHDSNCGMEGEGYLRKGVYIKGGAMAW